jgi:hypothetical protein
MIPAPDADWYEVSMFALKFDGYKECGSTEACAAIANAGLDTTLTQLRICLFFEDRRWRHFGESPDAGGMVYIRSLVEKIRAKVANQDLV